MKKPVVKVFNSKNIVLTTDVGELFMSTILSQDGHLFIKGVPRQCAAQGPYS